MAGHQNIIYSVYAVKTKLERFLKDRVNSCFSTVLSSLFQLLHAAWCIVLLLLSMRCVNDLLDNTSVELQPREVSVRLTLKPCADTALVPDGKSEAQVSYLLNTYVWCF